jgi:3-hydroxyisobutyrate dehydrogenase
VEQVVASAPDQSIGVVALLGAGGTMGQGMARNLAGAGLRVRAQNRTREKLEALAGADGIELCERPAEAVEGAGAFITMLSDADAVIETVDGALLDRVGDGSIWLQMSTIGIAGTDRCLEVARERGVELIDAPVLGTKKPAEDGELIVLASGPDSARARTQPIFEAVGKRTMWVGEAGAATRLKLAINAWIVSVVEGTAEMLALAEGLGVDPELPLEAIADGPLDLPYLRLKAKAMLEGDFTPSFRLALAAKDAGLAVAGAEDAGLELPMLEAIHARLAAAAEDHGDEDLAATFLASKPPPVPAG